LVAQVIIFFPAPCINACVIAILLTVIRRQRSEV